MRCLLVSYVLLLIGVLIIWYGIHNAHAALGMGIVKYFQLFDLILCCPPAKIDGCLMGCGIVSYGRHLSLGSREMDA